jgi:hypothetical protein
MTTMLSIDPGKNTGIALGYYDAISPYQLIARWQVHNGVEGFIEWWRREQPHHLMGVDEIVLEIFVLADNDFKADVTPLRIEGAIAALNTTGIPIIEQDRTAKGSLTGYPPEAKTKAQRQRVRFDFLKEHGLFVAGTENDDSNDAITHSLVSLKRRHHAPTIKKFWPPTTNRPVVALHPAATEAAGF